MESDNNELLTMLEKLPGWEEASAEDVREWMASDEVEEISDSDFVQTVTE